MNEAEITAHTLAHRFWERNKDRIREWIREDALNNQGETAEFTDFVIKFKANLDYNLTLDQFVNDLLEFLDTRESITSKIWNYLQQRYDSLVDSITSELEDTNDSDEHIKEEYYRSVL